jgi:hypothetical protein
MPRKSGYKVNPTSFVDYNEANFRNFELGLATDVKFNNRDYNLSDDVKRPLKPVAFKFGFGNVKSKKPVKSSSKSLKKNKTKSK